MTSHLGHFSLRDTLAQDLAQRLPPSSLGLTHGTTASTSSVVSACVRVRGHLGRQGSRGKSSRKGRTIVLGTTLGAPCMRRRARARRRRRGGGGAAARAPASQRSVGVILVLTYQNQGFLSGQEFGRGMENYYPPKYECIPQIRSGTRDPRRPLLLYCTPCP
jgi:hypothetical protein